NGQQVDLGSVHLDSNHPGQIDSTPDLPTSAGRSGFVDLRPQPHRPTRPAGGTGPGPDPALASRSAVAVGLAAPVATDTRSAESGAGGSTSIHSCKRRYAPSW